MLGYLARETWAHRIPAGAKLAALALVSLAVLPLHDWRILGASLVLTLALIASLGPDALKRLAQLRPIAVLLVVILLLHGLMGDWQTGVVTVLRLLTMILLADAVSMTTTMQDMMAALMPVLRPLKLFGLEPKKLALAVSLVVRFVPVLSANWEARAEAWRARTGRRPSWRLVGPFLADTLRTADRVAEALDARGFARRKD